MAYCAVVLSCWKKKSSLSCCLCNCGKIVSLSMLRYRSCVTDVWKKISPSTPVHKRPAQTVIPSWFNCPSIVKRIFCWIVDTVALIYSTWKFKWAWSDHVILSMMPLPCLLSFRTTLQNCKWRSGSSSNNPWSNHGQYIFKPTCCIRRLKDLQEMPNSIKALCFDFWGLFVNAWLSNIPFSRVVTLTGSPLYEALQMDPVSSNLSCIL